VVPEIERQHQFVGWAGGTTSIATRDGIQLKLLGDITQPDGLGRGLIPLDNMIGSPTMSRGVSNFVDTISLRRETGGGAIIRLKTFEQNRRAWQGESVDAVWMDEDDRTLEEIWGEALARLTATRGRIWWTATPVLGRTPTRKRFIEPNPDRAEILMGLNDATHIAEADREIILSRYKASERATRAYGADMAGEGAVFEVDWSEVTHRRDPDTFPTSWRWLFEVDFSHGGMSSQAHPFAAVLVCHDPSNDVIYVTDTWRLRNQLPINHAAAIHRNPRWDARVAWPGADGYQRDASSGTTFRDLYAKEGLNMLPQHATLPTGGFGLDAGITLMENRFASGRLKIASHLVELLEELRGYHRKDHLIVKEDDDLISALRQAVMDIRHARPLEPDRPNRYWTGKIVRRDGRINSPEAIAARNDFNVWDPYEGRSEPDPWGRNDTAGPWG
jgi:phage terminase large subunit-like protein